jgi:death-on-curing protein
MSEPVVYLTEEQVLVLHRRSIERYGGLPGLRDSGAFASAVAQPAAGFGGVEAHPRLVDKAAAYLYHLAQNHAFLDGNKRVAAAAASTFLAINGSPLPAGLDAGPLYDLTIAVATGQADKATIAARFQAWLL